ncbi:MAG: ATP-binding cassette domain-containing protein [Thermoleophilia bacterium]|nr:ATP-binding cassette domain-containing protein [Thermoleophilia bacterium]
MSLQLENIRTEVGDFSLKNISLQMETGECLVIVGPSGCGKTMLLDTIAGFHHPRAGRIILNRADITRARPEHRNLGYVPQNLALFPRLSVMENILFGARARKMPQEQARAKAMQLAELLGIEHLLERRTPVTLSGGEKQRVALARALLVEPRALLLDEPLSALDGGSRRQLVRYLRQVFDVFGVTVVYVTHDLQEAFLLADKVGVMQDGRLEQVGSREEVCYRPASLGVGRMFAGNNIFAGQVVELRPGAWARVRADEGAIWELPWREDLREGQPVMFGISPQDIVIVREDRPLPPHLQANVFAARVADVIDGYDDCWAFLEIEPDGERVEVKLPTYVLRDLAVTVNSHIRICFKKDCLWVLPRGEEAYDLYPGKARAPNVADGLGREEDNESTARQARREGTLGRGRLDRGCRLDRRWRMLQFLRWKKP